MRLYESNYTSLNFERAGLFDAIHEKYRFREVLYPGSSVHITPSLYFPHVVYVDQGEAAAQFFADEKSVREFVNRHKQYKQSAYIQFIQQDYCEPLPLREAGFDLLLALFAGGIAKSCVRYLKVGGYLLTNNHQGDALDAFQRGGLESAATIRFQKKAYSISEEIEEQEIIAQKSNNNYLKQADRGIKYEEHEIYFLFRRVR